LLAGLVLCFGGRQFLKELRFALLVLLLAIPLPAIVFNQITFPLQILASKLASALLPFFGVPVLREGNVIELPLMKLEVAEACSGIRSLMSLFTLAVFYGYFLEKSVWRAERWRWPAFPSPLRPTRCASSALACASSTGIRTRPWAFFTSFPAGSSFWCRWRACIPSIA
jgi:hypothetical protein